MAVKAIPDGFHSVTPHLTVPNVAQLIDFLKRGFGAQELLRHTTPDGSIMHAQVKIGDSIVMLGEQPDASKAMPGCFCLYVEDTDALYKRAIKAGGKSLREPMNR